jgi:endonuclease YncB( thermonuclease family)
VKSWLPALLALAAASAVRADPCEAPLPPRGQSFSGPVVYVGDGDSLCVGASPGRERDPSTWVEVRLADFYAPELHSPGGSEAKIALARITAGQRLICTADHRSYDRIVAQCRQGGWSVGDLMRRAGVAEGGNGR